MSAWWERPARFAPVLFTGGYAWSLTVAPAWGEAGATPLVRVALVVSLCCLFVAGWLAARAGVLALGLYGFVGTAAFVWSQTEPFSFLSASSRLLGVLGWVAYTFAWGSLSIPSRSSASTEQDRSLEARVAPRPGLVLLPITAALSGVALLVASETVSSPPWRVLLQVTALGVTLFLIRGASHLGQHLQYPSKEAWDLQNLRKRIGTGLLIVGVLGCLWWLFGAG